MLKNVGRIDQVIRFSVGLVVLFLTFWGRVHGRLGLLLAALGIYLLMSALLQYCPFYRLLKFSTGK
ncbi:YgaP family membrane protein [Candidatus Contubernalis alkaliaceticus]|uniref:YgaP family membrane protein n=1 Tax=Candidatus Contubernalis alkaliaceticus TaxID=338645 RepID=UPI001F4C1B44|nr:DUF2892 domain-containing protein [Candidatus Contubernalis alkalaceticus]UNC93435.1 DUF2892 domain-containing protein [Candidatus Contubernalis alkalaceticus]